MASYSSFLINYTKHYPKHYTIILITSLALGIAMQMSTLKRKAITSIHGRKLWHCKECNKEVQVAQHVTGREPSPYTGETIFWDYIVGVCGHVIGDWSH